MPGISVRLGTTYLGQSWGKVPKAMVLLGMINPNSGRLQAMFAART